MAVGAPCNSPKLTKSAVTKFLPDKVDVAIEES